MMRMMLAAIIAGASDNRRRLTRPSLEADATWPPPLPARTSDLRPRSLRVALPTNLHTCRTPQQGHRNDPPNVGQIEMRPEQANDDEQRSVRHALEVTGQPHPRFFTAGIASPVMRPKIKRIRPKANNSVCMVAS